MTEKKEHLHANTLSKDTKKTMKSRIIVAILMVVTIVPFIFVGDYAFLALVLLVLGVATHEIIKAPQSEEKKFSKWVYVVSYLTVYIPFLATFIINNVCNLNAGVPFYDYTSGFSDLTVGMLAFIIMSLFYFLLAMLDKKFLITDVFYFIVMNGILVFGLLSFLQLRYLPLYHITSEAGLDIYSPLIDANTRFASSTSLIFYLVIAVCGNDIMAYFTGVLFGKHKMIPNISPKKTWEGFAGGIIGSAILSGGFAFGLAAAGQPILWFMTLNHWYVILFFSILLPLVATLGDLIFSAIKRQFNVKDFGTFLRSHGGFLDRLDSILVSSIFLGIALDIIIRLITAL